MEGMRSGSSDQLLRKTEEELRDRLRELDCMYEITRIVERSGHSLPIILREIVEILPSVWKYPEIACARIVIGGQVFQTSDYRECRWRQSAEVFVHGERAGEVEVGYLESRPPLDEGPFLSGERKLINAVANRLRHIAEWREAERLLHERERDLRERMTHLTRVSTMGEMASSIAHEVNQPLTAIATYAQACRRLVEAGQAEESEVLDVLDRIGNEALRAGEIIHHLRDLVKKRVGKRVECSINELVEDVEILASVDARLHGVELDLALTPDLPPIIADGVQIQQVVLNLIRNGIDAVEDTDSTDREVLVSTGVTDTGGVLVKVSDSGSGLLEEHESEIFQPFFTTKEDGMGMGLSISRTIVSSHGGRMWFSRNPEGGTTFSFTIPAATEVNGGS